MVTETLTGSRLAGYAAMLRDRLATGQKLDGSGPLEPDALHHLAVELRNTPAEHFAYQTLQARAHASGRLATAEAQYIYQTLGEIPGPDGWSERSDLADRIVVTEALAALMRRSY